MPLAQGVQRTSRKPLVESRLLRSARVALSTFVAATFAVAVQLAPVSPVIQVVHADTPAPKAVIISAPSSGMTDSNLVDASRCRGQGGDRRNGCPSSLLPRRHVGQRQGQHPGRQPRRIHGPRLRLAQPLHEQAHRKSPGRHGLQLLRRQWAQRVHLLRRQPHQGERAPRTERSGDPRTRLLHRRQR